MRQPVKSLAALGRHRWGSVSSRCAEPDGPCGRILETLSYGLAGLWRAIYLHDSAAISALPGWGMILAVSIVFAAAMFLAASAVATKRTSADLV